MSLVRDFVSVSDVFDPDFEFDYPSLKEEIKRLWKSDDDKGLLVMALDQLLEIGEIDDDELYSMLAQSYSLGISPHEKDERLAEIWTDFANGNIGHIYGLLDRGEPSHENLRIDLILTWYCEPRAMSMFPLEACFFARCMNNFSFECGGVDSLANEAIFYSDRAIAVSQRLRSDEVRERWGEVVPSFFTKEQLDFYLQYEANAWFERGRAYELRYLSSDTKNAQLSGEAIHSMRKAVDLGNEDARYVYPAFVACGTADLETRVEIIARHAKDLVVADPQGYIKKADEIAEEHNIVDSGKETVFTVAYACLFGLSGFSKDENLAHYLFEVAAKHGDDESKRELAKFKKRLLGGWKYCG